jgi:hypothetical protein
MEASTVQFAAAARTLGRAARTHDLVVPAFRSPPRLERADRSIRRTGGGGATIAVRVRGRPWPAVLADMIEGVVAANGLVGSPADRARSALWEAVGPLDGSTGEPPSRRRAVRRRTSAGARGDDAVPAPRAA